MTAAERRVVTMSHATKARFNELHTILQSTSTHKVTHDEVMRLLLTHYLGDDDA